jgi:Spy/CpxP family protein refolding chaperone
MKRIAVSLMLAIIAASTGWSQVVNKAGAAFEQKKPGSAVKIKPDTQQDNSPLGSLQVAPGTWWTNPGMMKLLALTSEQQKKMDEVFQQFRLKLIDLNASLAREEAILEPLIAAQSLDESKILTQIDRIAGTRAELEKANARMLLGIRQSLTQEQWDKLPQKKLRLKL